MLHWNSDLQCQYVRQVASWWYATHGEYGTAHMPVKVEVLQFDKRKEVRITIDDLDLQVKIVVNGETLIDTTPDRLKELSRDDPVLGILRQVASRCGNCTNEDCDRRADDVLACIDHSEYKQGT